MNQLELLLRQPWTVAVEATDGEIVLSIEEIPEFFAAGSTAEEAEANFWEALASHLHSYVEMDEDPPQPREMPGAVFVTIDHEPDQLPVGEGAPEVTYRSVAA